MDEEQRNNEESEVSPHPETLNIVEVSPSSSPASLDANQEYTVSLTMETSQLAELDLGHYSESDALDAEGTATDEDFCAVMETATTGFSDPENPNSANVGHVHGELSSQQDSLRDFIEAIGEYDKLYDCYKSLKSVLERDINVFEDLKIKVEDAERNNDEEGLQRLVQETKEKFSQTLRFSPIRDAYVALHKELTKLKKHIDGVHDPS